jgi:hypothetical protein
MTISIFSVLKTAPQTSEKRMVYFSEGLNITPGC